MDEDLQIEWFFEFQFHKGAIRTLAGIIFYRAIVHFNSIKVRLELPVALSNRLNYYDFNSIKVRLELFC